MIIKPIIFPKKENLSTDMLYFQSYGDVSFDTNTQHLIFQENAQISFNSYFNSFSLNKWKEYTTLDNLFLQVTYQGNFSLSIFTRDLKDKLVFEQTQQQINLSSPVKDLIEIALPELDHDMVFFTLKALDDQSVFFEGGYCSQISEKNMNPTDICVVICTYKREEYIKKNIRILKKYILENRESLLHKHLSVFIVDNGKTLEQFQFGDDRIRIIPNKNAGGSGGFTRGLIEAMEDQQSFSHVLFMDDDTTIEPASLERTYTFLRFRQKQYKDVFIGGSMLNILKPTIQEEAGASWNGGMLVSFKKGIDLSSSYDLLYNETKDYYEYNAWFYCCIPLSVVSQKNLPLPIFIRGDDIEYGLRNIKNLVLLNGICIWHEPFELKYSSFLNYYIFRNLLICNALHYTGKSKLFFLKIVYKRIIKEILFYKYKEAELLLDGVEDYYKGIDWLKVQDPEKLHNEIRKKGYSTQRLEGFDSSYLDSFLRVYSVEKENVFSKLFRIITLNGYCFKAKHNRIINFGDLRTREFYRAKNILFYDRRNLQVVATKKSYRSLFKIIKRTIKVSLMTLTKYKKTNLEYKKRQGEITNMEFWKEYLGLK